MMLEAAGQFWMLDEVKRYWKMLTLLKTRSSLNLHRTDAGQHAESV